MAVSLKNWWFLKFTLTQKLLVFLIAIAQFSNFASYSLLGPFFPAEAKARGVSTSVQGVIFGSYAVGQIVFCPIVGKVISRFGCRNLITFGLLLTGISNIAYGFLTYFPVKGPSGTTWYIILNTAIRIITALGSSTGTVTALTIISQHFEKDRLFLLGFSETMIGAGLMAGPAIGGALFTAGGFYLPFLVMGIICMVTGVFGFFITPTDVVEMSEEDAVKLPASFFLTPRALLVTVSIAFSGLSLSIFGPILQPFLQQFDVPMYQVALFFSLLMGGYMISAPGVAAFIERVNDSKYIMLVGYGVTFCACLAVGPSPIFGIASASGHVWLVIICLGVYGVAGALVLVPTFDQFIDLLEKKNLPNNYKTFGMVSGVWNSAYSLGDFLGPVSAGLLYDNMGFEWSMTIYAILTVLLMISLGLLTVYEAKYKPYKLSILQEDAELSSLLDKPFENIDMLTVVE